ncbi:MAG TPA: hypothetical protein DET40_25215 [Lentisphaeria bacterium]|nr:MAG: hypothetical protein A2X45_18750 [Lentisphaerae bacterium GWF2_50_93]HCE46861.1 hypothetical protein [Lentisphaeria bacterium]
MKKPILALVFLLAFAFYSAKAQTAQDKIFPADAVVNVTLPPYGAKPDDGIDDTAAIQKAVTENVDTGRFIYFPAGTYDISDTLYAKNSKGVWRPHLTLQGQNQDKTILRLKDKSANFADPAKPSPLIVTASAWEKGDTPSGGGNKAFRNNIFDMTVDTGSGNPGAVGVDYAVSNIGSIENVLIRSGDGQGSAGISMVRRIPGPGLIKNVTIIGFDVGFDYADGQYGMTLENITLKDQKKYGIRLTDNVLHIRRLTSENKVPAVIVTNAIGVLTLIDSKISGGTADRPAIDCSGSLLVRNTSIEGYRQKPVRYHGTDLELGKELAKSAVPGSATAEPAALLSVEETPGFWNADLADWVAVGARKDGEKDDTAAIQRAIDSGKSTVYFPNNRIYFLSDTLIVRGSLKQIIGMGSEINLGAAKEAFSNIRNPRPLIRIDETKADIVFFENIFFNAQYPGEVIFENNSPKTVVIRHCGGWVGGDGGNRHAYRNTENGTGKLFIEDAYLPGWEIRRQSVWARQLNPENNNGDGSYAQVLNIGARLWILGFKTEGPAPFIETRDGGVTELLGAYNYVSATDAEKVPAESVPYIVKDSKAALSFVSENFRDNDYKVYIREIIGDETKDLKGADLLPRNGNKGDRSFVVPLYRSHTKNPE